MKEDLQSERPRDPEESRMQMSSAETCAILLIRSVTKSSAEPSVFCCCVFVDLT